MYSITYRCVIEWFTIFIFILFYFLKSAFYFRDMHSCLSSPQCCKHFKLFERNGYGSYLIVVVFFVLVWFGLFAVTTLDP